MMVFDCAGNFLHSWGEGGMFPRAHGLHIDAKDNVWCTDDGAAANPEKLWGRTA